jgi:hypothetical protein
LQLKEKQAAFAQQTADGEEKLKSAATIQVSVCLLDSNNVYIEILWIREFIID